jgi:GT2 family glycosyltransferase
MLTWNTRDLTVQSLRHLLDTDQGVTLRLLVRDNASTDGTAEALAREVPEAEVDVGQRNLGFAAGMNALLTRTTADWVLVLNSDAWPEPGAIAAMLRAGTAQADLAAVAPRLLRPDGSLEFSTFPFPSIPISLLYATGLRALLPSRLAAHWMLPPRWLHDRPREVSWAVGAALLIPRTALQRVGGFDPSYFMYGEDVDWSWRARTQGLHVWFEPDAVVRHIGGVSAEHRYPGAVARAKAAASIRVVGTHRSRLSGRAYRWLEAVAGLRCWAMAVLRQDVAGREQWATSARAFLHPALVEPAEAADQATPGAF